MPELCCQFCGAAIARGEPIPREAECDGCGRDLHACRQCRHHDPAHHNACREPAADPVVDKERRNFCEFFSFRREPGSAPDAARAQQARAKLAGLFGAGSPERGGAAEDARARLEALFKKPPPSEE